MSKQSKLRNKARLAKQLKGSKGPARTTKTNKKRNTWFSKGKVAPAAPARDGSNANN